MIHYIFPTGSSMESKKLHVEVLRKKRLVEGMSPVERLTDLVKD